jgi:hypothetical protein
LTENYLRFAIPTLILMMRSRYVAARTAFDPSLQTEALIADFTTHFYSAEAAPHVRQYMQIMAKAFTTANTSLDFNGRPLTGDPSRHMGITNAVFANKTLLLSAAALSAAKTATAHAPRLIQLRLDQAMLNVLWVILQRWDGLREFAAAQHIAWPLPSTSKAAAFDTFARGLTFAFAQDEPGFDSGEHGSLQPYFYEHIPVSPGSSRYTSKTCNLECFKTQLGL